MPLLLAIAMVMAASACDRTADGNAAQDRGAAAAPPVATPAGSDPTAAAASDADVTMRYDCAQGHRVAIAGDEARVTLADGREVALPRVEGSAPPRFVGEALSFSVNATGAVLGQDEAGGFDCTAD